MSPSDKNRNFDKLLSDTFGRNEFSFDFDKWKLEHVNTIKEYQLKTQERSHRFPQMGIPWRKIMNSSYTKLAIASMVIIAITIASNKMGFQPDGTTIAWAEVIEELQNVKWTHITGEETTPDGKRTTEKWACYNPYITAQKGSGSSTIFKDYQNRKQYHYSPHDPDTNKITVLPITEIDSILYQRMITGSTNDLSEHYRDVLELFTGNKATITRELKTVEGRDLEVICSETEQYQVTLYYDTEKKRLVRTDRTFQIERPSSDHRTKKARNKIPGPEQPQKPKPETHTVTQFFDYTNSGPKDIYELGVPEDAEIVNYCPEGQLAQLLAIVTEKVFKNYGDHIGTVLESAVSDTGTLEPTHVNIMWQKGIDQR